MENNTNNNNEEEDDPSFYGLSEDSYHDEDKEDQCLRCNEQIVAGSSYCLPCSQIVEKEEAEENERACEAGIKAYEEENIQKKS